jgi:methylated-DNA-[protein]-cysteine S-methyltransferase
MVRVRLGTPIGDLTAFVRGDALVALDLPDTPGPAAPALPGRFPGEAIEDARDAIDLGARFRAYLAGDLGAIDAIVVDPGGTPFQRAVWAELRRIPAGRTRSYAEMARTIGAPTAVRAVGAANGANPIAIVIPCHRVVASDGGLGGYGGGLARKRWLLEHERAVLPAGARLQRTLFA